MIQTWIADVKPLMERDVYHCCYRQVPVWRQEKAERLRYQKDKALSIGVWRLYEMACREINVSEAAVFNLSHSGQYVLCSVDDREDAGVKVGCDLETIREGREDIAHHYFTEDEYSYVMSGQTSSQRQENFYRLWVLKESFMKATRRGLGMGLRSFEISFEYMDLPRLVYQPEDIKERYYFKEYLYPISGCRIAVCSTDDQFSEKLLVRDLI